jgi:hypothetical protein
LLGVQVKGRTDPMCQNFDNCQRNENIQPADLTAAAGKGWGQIAAWHLCANLWITIFGTAY